MERLPALGCSPFNNTKQKTLKDLAMPKRNSPNDIKKLDDLNDLQNIVVDKRNVKRKTEKRNRRDRHYNKLFIKIALKNYLEANAEEE